MNHFDMLIGSVGENRYESLQDVLYLIASCGVSNDKDIDVNNKIVDTIKFTVKYDKFQIRIGRIEINNASSARSYKLEIEAKRLDDLVDIRHPIVAYLARHGMRPIHILRDDVSKHFATDLYPGLYEIENLMRAYLTEFWTTRLGLEWWSGAASGDQNKKAYQRKNNESFFGELIDSKLHLTDFGDLGKIVYQQSSGAQTKEEVLEMLSTVVTLEDFDKFKTNLQTNYDKFFKEYFKDSSFEDKWIRLEKIRHKVAHNGLISKVDYDDGKELLDDLRDIILRASAELPSVEINSAEIKSIADKFQKAEGYVSVDREVFLRELNSAEAYFSDDPSAYVGLSHFAVSWLGKRGYDYRSSFEMANILADEGSIQIYEVDHPHVQSIKAIRLKSKSG